MISLTVKSHYMYVKWFSHFVKTRSKNQILNVVYIYLYQFYLVKILSLLFIYYTMIVFQLAASSIHNNLLNCILSDTKYQIPHVYKAGYKAHTRLHFFVFSWYIARWSPLNNVQIHRKWGFRGLISISAQHWKTITVWRQKMVSYVNSVPARSGLKQVS